jgi:hypothetical protein
VTRAVLLCGLLALAPTAARAAEKGEWESVSQHDGVVVDRRAVPGSSLKEFRGRAVIDAPLAAILAVFSDVGRATEWMDRCKASSLVDDLGDREKVVYNRTGAPWPVADRDAVLHNLVSFDPEERRVRLEFSTVDSTKMPPQKGAVRMPFLRGHWYFWPESERRTRVEYQVHANPGGRLPVWLINYASRDLPHKTIAGLRAQLKRRSYPEMEQHIRGLPEFRALEEKLAANTR